MAHSYIFQSIDSPKQANKSKIDSETVYNNNKQYQQTKELFKD